MSSSSRARSRASACSSWLNSSGSMTFCSSERPGIRLGNWKTKPMVRLRRLLRSASLRLQRSTPSTVTVPLVGVGQAGGDVEQRRLAAAGAPGDDEEVVDLDVEVDVAQGGEGRGAVAAVGLADPAQ